MDGEVDSVVSDLQDVARESYGQYCGLARAIEAVGERWGMLVVRDLLVNPKSAPELAKGLPRVPMNLLTMRIDELAYNGILELAGMADPDGHDRYRLTTYGRRLEDILLALGRWGSAMLAEPRPEDIVTEDSLMVAMRASFQPGAARGRSERYDLVLGHIVIHLVIEDGQLEVGRGPLHGATVIEPGPFLKDMMTRAMSVEEAKGTGTVKVLVGDENALDTFVSMFALPNEPAPQRAVI